MARFLLFVLLLIIGWGLIFLPLFSHAQPVYFSWWASPSDHLPQPWQAGASLQVHPQANAAEGSDGGDAAPGACANEITLQQGETLGGIARRCAITLESLLAANPQIGNPNRVQAGQMIHIPALAGRGGGGDINPVNSSGAYSPGSQLNIQASGLPANSPARIGIGLSRSGYHVLQEATIGGDGELSLAVTIPENAIPGDIAFIMVTTSGVPSTQVISAQFSITNRE